MGNGSTKPGDALADRYRDEFDKNRAARRRARANLMSRPDVEDADDSQQIQAILGDSEVPSKVKGAVGFLAAFPKNQRIVAWGILALLLGVLFSVGGVKVMQALGWLP